MESSRVKDSFSGHHAPSFNYKNKEMLKQSVETQSHITELQTLTVTVHDVSHSAKTTDPLCSSWESFLSFCRMIHRRVCARAVECFLFFQLCTCVSGFAHVVLSNLWCLGMKGYSLPHVVFKDTLCTFKCTPHPLHFSLDSVIKVNLQGTERGTSKEKQVFGCTPHPGFKR